MWDSSGKIGIAETTKRTKMVIGWLALVKNRNGGSEVEHFRGENVVEIDSHMKRIGPIFRGYGSMRHEGASDVINTTNHSFRLPIFR